MAMASSSLTSSLGQRVSKLTLLHNCDNCQSPLSLYVFRVVDTCIGTRVPVCIGIGRDVRCPRCIFISFVALLLLWNGMEWNGMEWNEMEPGETGEGEPEANIFAEMDRDQSGDINKDEFNSYFLVRVPLPPCGCLSVCLSVCLGLKLRLFLDGLTSSRDVSLAFLFFSDIHLLCTCIHPTYIHTYPHTIVLSQPLHFTSPHPTPLHFTSLHFRRWLGESRKKAFSRRKMPMGTVLSRMTSFQGPKAAATTKAKAIFSPALTSTVTARSTGKSSTRFLSKCGVVRCGVVWCGVVGSLGA